MIEPVRDNRGGSEPGLVSLLATIIRHRAWVLWTTGIGTFVGLVVLIFLPLLGVTLFGVQTLTLQAQVRVVTVPTEAQSFVNFDVSAIIQAQRSNFRLLAEIYRDTMMTSQEATLTRPALNRVVRMFVEKSFRVIPDSPSSMVSLSLKVKEQDQDKGTQFLKQFVTATKTDLDSYARTQTAQAIGNLELSSKVDNGLVSPTSERYQLTSKALKGLLANSDFPMALVGGIEAVEDGPGIPRSSQVFISFLCSMLIGILLAFAVEAVNRIRRDLVSVELIKKAWRGE